jgi:two-component system sensor histidine kinase DegS
MDSSANRRLSSLRSMLGGLLAAASDCRGRAAVILDGLRDCNCGGEESRCGYENLEAYLSKLGELIDTADESLRRLVAEIDYLEERQQTGPRIVRAQEDERRRVARDIHDGPAQTMTNLVLRAEICERLMDRDPSRLRHELTELKLSVKEALAEIRRIISDLRPMALDDLGLVPAVRQYYEDMAAKCGWSGGVEVNGEAKVCSTTEVTVFRLVQEALQNARKHSEATEVRVEIAFSEQSVMVAVSDNGKGFDSARASLSAVGRERFGLVGMRERVSLLGGSFEVVSSPGCGTSVRAEIPLSV